MFKAECLQRTGSFKFRGACNKLALLSSEQRSRGVVAYSSGNHAQGVAAAAKALGVDAKIIIPADAPALKIANTRALGAKVILYDRYRESREPSGKSSLSVKDGPWSSLMTILTSWPDRALAG
ncbi:MAG: pyridoxal-phosphate dependent enzyme [Thiolinea sp.]